MATKVNDTFAVFHDLEGNPLEAGYIYIGQPNLDAETNPKAAYWDVALTIPAAQPIRTIAGRAKGTSGSPADVYVDGEYSITVKDKNLAFVTAGGGGTSAPDDRVALGLSGFVVPKSEAYTATLEDRSKVILCTGSFTLSLASASALGNGWYVDVISQGGAITIDPSGSETIDGLATGGVSPGGSLRVVCDGSGFYTEFSGDDQEFAPLTALDDLNVLNDGVYGWEASIPSNAPFGGFSFLSQLSHDGGTRVQYAYGSPTSQQSVRYYNGTTWGAWANILTSADILDEDDFASDSATKAPSQQSVKAYVDAASALQIGVGQTWQDVTSLRNPNNTAYQNTTGRPILVSVTTGFGEKDLDVSADGVTWMILAKNQEGMLQAIIPDGHYYRVNGSVNIWAELR